MSQLKTKLDSFISSVAAHLNGINNAINGKVNTATYNNQTTQFQTQITNLTTDLNNAVIIVSKFKGLRFEADQATSKISLKNEEGELLTELNVGFLNNEGTKFNYNTTTQELELRNDSNELLSSIPLSGFITNIANNISFNANTPSVLELKNSNGSIASSVNFGIQNVNGLEQRLNSIKTIFNSDEQLSGNRIVNISDKYLRFVSTSDTFEFKDNKFSIPNIFTNKYGVTQSGQILSFLLNNNLPKIMFGNPDTNELEINSKNIIFKNLKKSTTHNKTVVINEAGEIAYAEGVYSNFEAGDGITINGNIISLTPSDQINLIFNW